jgi:hypothetical protein
MAGIKNVYLPIEVVNARRLGTAPKDQLLAYPLNLGVHYMLFRFSEYNRYLNNTQDKKYIYSVALPMPENFVEEFENDFSEGALGLWGVIPESPDVQNLVTNPSLSGIGDFAKKMMQGASSNALDLAAILGRVALNRTQAGEAIEQWRGNVLNPHLVTVFNGTKLRTFNWNWKIVPESPENSEQFYKIYEIFQIGMLPEEKAGRILLHYPLEVDISIGGQDVKYSAKFKSAVIRDIKLNRHASGKPVFFRQTGAEAVLDFSITIQEIEAWTRDDVANQPYIDPAPMTSGRDPASFPEYPDITPVQPPGTTPTVRPKSES